jgi:hypothetical protein
MNSSLSLSQALDKLIAGPVPALVSRLLPRRKLTIALLSFNRPEYLRAALSSLKPQLISGDEVFLFQDGCYNYFSRRKKEDVDVIRNNVAIFNNVMSGGKTAYSARAIVSPLNLGVAGNYRRAEDFVFSELGRDSVLLLEDDLVLGPHYLFVIDRMLALAQRNPAIGYVSAYGDLWASLAQQKSRLADIIPMHENWGAALTRRSWLTQKHIREQYWELVKDVDYSLRDHEKITAFYESIGYRCSMTSQDTARWVACCATGMIRITTGTCHARYIGKQGEHSCTEHYDRYRFSDSEIFGTRPYISMPSPNQIDEWLAASKKSFREGYVHSYAANSRDR